MVLLSTGIPLSPKVNSISGDRGVVSGVTDRVSSISYLEII